MSAARQHLPQARNTCQTTHAPRKQGLPGLIHPPPVTYQDLPILPLRRGIRFPERLNLVLSASWFEIVEILLTAPR